MRKLFGLLPLLSLTTACGLSISEPIPPIVFQPTSAEAGQPMSYTQTTNVSAQDTGPATTANLQSLTFALDTADGGAQNFDFLNEVQVFINTDGGSQVEIADLASVPRGVSTLSLDVVPGVNLKPYLAAGCTVSTVLDGTFPSQTVNFSGEIDAWVGVQL